MIAAQAKYDRLSLVEVELLGKLGGSRTYTYRYNLHYGEPEAGDVVIVPFGSAITAGMVLKTTDLTEHSLFDTFWAEAAGRALLTKLRPVVGIGRDDRGFEGMIARARAIMNGYLRPAGSALGFWLVSSFEREIGVFFFALRTKTGSLNTSTA